MRFVFYSFVMIICTPYTYICIKPYAFLNVKIYLPRIYLPRQLKNMGFYDKFIDRSSLFIKVLKMRKIFI